MRLDAELAGRLWATDGPLLMRRRRQRQAIERAKKKPKTLAAGQGCQVKGHPAPPPESVRTLQGIKGKGFAPASPALDTLPLPKGAVMTALRHHCARLLFTVGEALDVPGNFVCHLGIVFESATVAELGLFLCRPGRWCGALAWRYFPAECQTT